MDASPTVYGAAQSRSSASAANQSARGPGVTRSGPGSGGLGVSSGAGGPAGVPTGSVVPSSTRGGTDPGQGVGRPRAEHGRDVDTAGDRDVGPHARGRRPEPEPATGGQPLGPVATAPGAVHLDRRRRPGHRHPDSGVGGQLEPAPGHLEQRRVGSVADQPVGERRGRPVQRTGPGDAEVRQAGAATVLDGGERTGALDGQASCRHEPDPGARCEQGGLAAVGVPEGQVGVAQQPPATR